MESGKEQIEAQMAALESPSTAGACLFHEVCAEVAKDCKTPQPVYAACSSSLFRAGWRAAGRLHPGCAQSSVRCAGRAASRDSFHGRSEMPPLPVVGRSDPPWKGPCAVSPHEDR